MPWAADFGRQCQEPDFATAQTRQWQEQASAIRHGLGPWKLPLLGAAGLLLGGGIALWRRRAGSQGL